MATKPIEEALLKIPNRFLLTTIVARRWENLVAGAQPLVETRPGMSKIDAVFEEILEDRIEIDESQRTVQLVGEPQVEENEEPLYSEAFSPGENPTPSSGA
ncbi:MAG: DNA-directed RNA polymerase subunit omega [Acidobacteria bacterium]|nr:DNA-directed RNA polymerase subunit omega [Acidobacteriota bacterium]